MNRKKHDKKTILFIILIPVVLSVIVFLCVRHKASTAFHYEDNLDTVVITVDDASVTLREFGYYIYDTEAFVQQQALLYNPQDPCDWWNTHFSAGAESTFVCDYAQKVAADTCICNEIYCKEALRLGISLEPEEKIAAAAEAKDIYNNMSAKQREVTGLTESKITEIKTKQALSAKYAGILAKTANFAGYAKEPQALLNWDGEYYRDKILPQHTVTENSDILDNLTFGKITVNRAD